MLVYLRGTRVVPAPVKGGRGSRRVREGVTEEAESQAKVLALKTEQSALEPK